MTIDELHELVVAGPIDIAVEDARGYVWAPTRSEAGDRGWWHCYDRGETRRTADLDGPLDVLVRMPLVEWEGPT